MLTKRLALTRFAGAETPLAVITGTPGADTLNGAGTADTISGLGGNDLLNGLGGGDTLLGGAGNDTLNGGNGIDSMTGGTGNDVYVVDNAADVVTENTGAGTDTVQSSVSVTLSVNVENLLLTGAASLGIGNDLSNVITGSSAANHLLGQGGNDTIDGGGGIDTLEGGDGDDTFILTVAGTDVVEFANQGTDSVQASLSYLLTDNVENLTLTGSGDFSGTGNVVANQVTGNSGNNQIDGDVADDTLRGGAGNDTLVGGAGIDSLVGGEGDDTYSVDSTSDIVVEDLGQGIDTVQSSASFTLAANVENLFLQGSAFQGTGNELSNFLQGNSGNNQLDGKAGADTTVGGLGNDTYFVDDVGDVVLENAGEGSNDTVISTVSYTLSAELESLFLSSTGDINGTGNALSNSLTGDIGNNVLDGKAGADVMVGTFGDDTYIVDNAGDVAAEFGGTSSGIDIVLSSVSFTLGNFVENLTLTGGGLGVNASGTGNDLNNVIVGNIDNNTLSGGFAGDDTLNGGGGSDSLDGGSDNDSLSGGDSSDTLKGSAGNDSLDGGDSSDSLDGGTGNDSLDGGDGSDTLTGGTGADAMIGGLGDDFFSVDNAGDTVSENAAGGIDRVSASVSFTLSADVENLTLSGSANINGTGNALANVITGNTGNNTIDGGLGADTLIGGLGSDSYVVDDAGDIVTENLAEGVDVVQSSVSVTLADNVENLTLTGAGNINGTGNALANVLTGNVGNNALNGGVGADTVNGGAGADTLDARFDATPDTLNGGTGDDTYFIDSLADIIVENAGEGIDTVNASIDFTLGANLENLTLLAPAVNATGNGLANVLTGNALNNTLDGKGGANTMIGGAGNDIYVVSVASNVVVENANEGLDAVQASVSFTLSTNVENLTLTGVSAINGTGSSDNNTITGNSGSNSLSGGAGNDTLNGGTGAAGDTMNGGAGNDIFVVDSALDLVVEASGEGTDLVQSSILTYTLTTNVENLTLTGSNNLSGTGNSLANAITGNSGANSLSGADGDDTLNGGAGDDTLAGGLGNDTYVIDTTTDLLVEGVGAGIDTVQIDIPQNGLTYTLAAEFENLVIAGVLSLNGDGNALDNVLTGNSSNNTLRGLGGNDTLNAGDGDDQITDALGETTVVDGGAGNDTIEIHEDGGSLLLLGTFEGGSNTDTLFLDANGLVDITAASISNIENLLTGDLVSLIATMTQLESFSSIAAPPGNTLLISLADGGTLDLSSELGTQDVWIIADPGLASAIQTGSGDDEIDGSAFDDTLSGNGGNDRLLGSNGADILLGGSGNDTLQGAEGTNTLDGGSGADSMDAGSGNDVYVVDNAGDAIADAGGVDLVQSSISFTLGTGIENLILLGSANINGTGNSAGNVLIGNSGNNTLSGGAGDDTVNGGVGNDTIVETVNTLVNLAVLNGEDGNDTIRLDVSGFDLLMIGTMDGGSGGDTLDLENATSFDGVDLSGATISNIETLTVEDNLLVTATVAQLESFAIIFSTGFLGIQLADGGVLDLSSELESVSTFIQADAALAASVTSGLGNDTLLGSASNDTLISGGGADQLDGSSGNDSMDGGLGNDTMFGEAGNDTYVVDTLSDSISENPGEGTDTVKSSISYTLATNFENLTLTGSANLSGTGNSVANVITGNSGNNALNGSTGADTMIGGLGDDTYTVDNASDVITENLNAGFDVVQSSASYTLSANIEVLTLTGSSNLNGTGNTINNAITGNSGANSLSGSDGDDILNGLTGNDTMVGGNGNDTFTVDSTSDVVTEASGGGTDIIFSSVSLTLGSNVENLTLTGSAKTGTGNSSGNSITGTSGGNTLNGMDGNDVLNGADNNDILVGGAGQDTLTGGVGADTFKFNAVTETGDMLTDFVHLTDKIDMSVIDANTAVLGDQAFAFVAAQTHNVVAHSLTWFQSGGNTFITCDVNGDTTGDFAIVLSGLISITASDFTL